MEESSRLSRGVRSGPSTSGDQIEFDSSYNSNSSNRVRYSTIRSNSRHFGNDSSTVRSIEHYLEVQLEV